MGTSTDESLLIVGAGYTGQRLLARARSSGDYGTVIAVRSAEWNLDDPASTPPCRPARVMYLVPPAPAGTGDERLRHALDTLLAPGHRVHRWVYASTTGVYGDTGGAMVDEDTPPAPRTARAQRRLAAESMLRRRCSEAGVEWCVLRIPGIYGPGRLPAERLRRGDPLPQSAAERPGNRIHVDDLVTAMEMALRHPAAANAIFNVGDGDCTPTFTFQSRLAALTGLAPPALLPDDEVRRQLSAEAWSFLAESRRVDSQRIRERLGFAPRYADCSDGIRASLEPAPR